MNYKIILAAISLYFATCTNAFADKNYIQAAQQCSNNKDEQTISRCLDVLIDNIDRDMQAWVNNQTFILEELALKSGRSSALSMFKRAQSNFVKYQEDNCRWQYLAISPNKMANISYKQCYIHLSVTRINELKRSSNSNKH